MFTNFIEFCRRLKKEESLLIKLPFLYFIIRKHSVLPYLFITIVFVALNYLFLSEYLQAYVVDTLNFLNSKWKEIYLLDILIFFVGMHMPSWLQGKGRAENKKHAVIEQVALVFLFSLILLEMVSVKYSFDLIDPFSRVLINNMSILLITLFSTLGIHFKVHIGLVSFFGALSYPLYLYHMLFYCLVDKVTGETQNSLQEIFRGIILFSVFLFICMKLEQVARKQSFLLGRGVATKE